jgi:hypothetical protein
MRLATERYSVSLGNVNALISSGMPQAAAASLLIAMRIWATCSLASGFTPTVARHAINMADVKEQQKLQSPLYIMWRETAVNYDMAEVDPAQNAYRLKSIKQYGEELKSLVRLRACSAELRRCAECCRVASGLHPALPHSFIFQALETGLWVCACPIGSLHFASGSGTVVCDGDKAFASFAQLDCHESTLLTGLSISDYKAASVKITKALAAARTAAAEAAGAGRGAAGAGAAAPPS